MRNLIIIFIILCISSLETYSKDDLVKHSINDGRRALIGGGNDLDDSKTGGLVSKLSDYTMSVIPASPSMHQMAVYGNIPMNDCSGAFTHSIPLYTIQQGDIVVPLSIGYKTNGVRVNDLSTVVGTGWIFNAGGAVSRTMRGYPDERKERWYPNILSKDILIDFTNVANATSHQKKMYEIAYGHQVDTEQDWFSFNVNGLSGSFFLDQDLNPHFSGTDYVSISIDFNSTKDFINKITIIDKNGFQYVFGGDNYYEHTTTTDMYNYIAGKMTNFVSAWMLKEIISPLNNSVKFSYSDNKQEYNERIGKTASWLQPSIESPEMTWKEDIQASRFMDIDVAGKVLKSITFGNNIVECDYNLNRPDALGASLKKLVIKTDQGKQVKQIDLKYDFMYDGNSSNFGKDLGPKLGSGAIPKDSPWRYRLFLKQIDITGSNTEDMNRYSFEYYSPEKLSARLALSTDLFGFYNGYNNDGYYPKKIVSETVDLLKSLPGNRYSTAIVEALSANLDVNPTTVNYGALKTISYPTGGYTEINYEPNKTVDENNKTIYLGGIRVKQLIDFDGNTSNKRTFFYNKLSEYKSTKSSVTTKSTGAYYILQESYPIHYKKLLHMTPDPKFYKDYEQVGRISLYASPYLDLYNTRVQSPNYKYVTELIGDENANIGAIERTYLDTPNGGVSGRIHGAFIPSSGVSTNLESIYYGLLENEKVYRNENGVFKLSKSTGYKYKSFERDGLQSYILYAQALGYELNKYDIGNVTLFRYDNLCITVKNSEITDTTFISNNSYIVNRRTLDYGENPYLNLKEEKQLMDNTIYTTKYTYPNELQKTMSYMDNLVSENRIIPIITENQKTINGQTKSIFTEKKEFGLFDKLVLPKNIYTKSGTGTYVNRVTFEKYDTKGNILKYSTESDLGVVYIWGYGGQYPVAEVKNATYAAVQTALGATPESLSSTANPNFMLINGLRDKLPNAHITTYEYQPLVGITKMTDPRGVVTTYEYDSFGRLKATYITEGSVKRTIQEYQYNYKNQ